MKKNPLKLKGTPAVTCFCAIGMVVLWYLSIVQDNGEWYFDTQAFSFEGYTPFGIFTRLIVLAIPVVLFMAVLFLAERSLRWVLPALLLPVAHQVANAIYYLEEPDVILANPVQLILPFLTLILYALTVERILPTRWIFVGANLLFALLPLALALLKVGEFVYTADAFDYDLYTYVTHVMVDWSSVLTLFLYYLGLAVFGIQMKEALPTAEEAAPSEPEASDEDNGDENR